MVLQDSVVWESNVRVFLDGHDGFVFLCELWL